MNTYKFSVGKYLHESKRLRQELLNNIVKRFEINQVQDLWQIELYGDHMGPGLYDSQLFLNSFKNWMINPSNLSSSQTADAANRKKAAKANIQTTKEPAITKENDQSFAPYSELALFFPFGVFRGIASSSSNEKTNKTIKKAQKRKQDTTKTPKEPENKRTKLDVKQKRVKDLRK